MDLQQTLREHIINQCLKGDVPDDFDDDYNLIDAGILDSLAIINLVSYLENQHHIAFGDDDIVPEHFMSVNALTAFAQQKLTTQ